MSTDSDLGMANVNRVPLVLGLDPSTTSFGWGALRVGDHSAPRFVACGAVRPKARLSRIERLASISLELARLLVHFKPSLVAVETPGLTLKPMAQQGVSMGLGLVVGVVGGRAPVLEYRNSTVKKVATGYGNAPKNQVAAMMARHLDQDLSAVSGDASDALAVAFCSASRDGQLACALDRGARFGA